MLFEPYTLKNITLKNRIVMAPMCMYSVEDESGKVQDWHKVHYTARAVGQVGLVILEATAVTPQGRISANDLGIWSDEHIAGLKELTDLIHVNGAHAGIQIAHAGRKAELEGTIVAPSAIAFSDRYQTPAALTKEQIKETVEAFKEGARRAKEAGFDVIELHGAHGYLINQFLSPLSNQRDDEYGGSRENRFRILREIIEQVKTVWDGPLLVRVSADEYAPEGNQMEDHVMFANWMKELGVDLVDVSSGGVVHTGPTKVYPGYQVPLSEQIKHGADVPTGAVGLITDPNMAEEILQNGRADLIFLGRELLRDPYWPRAAAAKLGAELEAPEQYKRGW